jgi:hypothetical protein
MKNNEGSSEYKQVKEATWIMMAAQAVAALVAILPEVLEFIPSDTETHRWIASILSALGIVHAHLIKHEYLKGRKEVKKIAASQALDRDQVQRIYKAGKSGEPCVVCVRPKEEPAEQTGMIDTAKPYDPGAAGQFYRRKKYDAPKQEESITSGGTSSDPSPDEE